VTVFLCGVAIAILGNRCHAPTIMLTNFVITPIELRYLLPLNYYFSRTIYRGAKKRLYSLGSSTPNLNADENNLIK
jgi:hypothetical protein